VNSVVQPFRILIADRNRHVREFLRRELTTEGYQVEVAGDGREVLLCFDREQPPHLLILDLEVPYVMELEVLARLKNRRPPVPVVIHTCLPESVNHNGAAAAAAFLEKNGDTNILKAVVADVIGKHYPQPRAGSREGVEWKTRQM
jgi:DNA-binding response OmpR family regulator